ncbi:MAG: D-glycero-beta-D-manno-heptose-7-phosphate kinase [Alphaproteobacteria bacterium]|nr:D-glycero-beta-D-manno-heptose-7-phosphate kinase [Alphaproteobacteria bacterium]
MKKASTSSRNDRFSGILKALEGVPVTVAGDVMLDRFVYGEVERISPESPVPVLAIGREDTMLGGAGNALANLAGLKASGKILSVIGDDVEGKLVTEKARSLGLDVSGLLTDKDRPTIVKTRFLAGHQQLLRTDSESRIPVPEKIAAGLLKKAETLLKNSKALILSDYGKGLLQPEFVTALIALAKKNKIPVIVDPKGRDFSLYKGADVITPNRKELAEASGMPVATDEEVIAAAEKIISTCGIGCVVATRSRDGMSVIRKNKKPVHFHGRDIEVFDVSGAGDTVIAVLAAALAAGAEIEDAAQLANIAGGIAVTKVGTAPIRADELLEAVHDENDGFAYADKKAPLATWDQAAEEIKRWKARGLKTGFTNGCFDILHAGHVQYLNAARGQCDRLIVGLNRDISVRLLKGEDRPVHDENARAAVLAALACVDMVVLFGAETKGGDNTASELLKLLQPDLYFKGGDYKPEQIPEAPAIRSYGGEIRITSNFEGHSTTKSIKKIRTEAA